MTTGEGGDPSRRELLGAATAGLAAFAAPAMAAPGANGKEDKGMSENVTERGLKLFGEIMGKDREAQMRASIDSGHFGSAIGKLATDYAFGSVWSRDGLERKQRSLVVIGVLIAQRQIKELQNHVRIGITNGLTVREIEEALIQTVPYVGFPAGASATSAIVEVLRDMGLDTETKTAEERGML